MAEGVGQPVQPQASGFIRNPQDFWGGVGLVAFAIVLRCGRAVICRVCVVLRSDPARRRDCSAGCWSRTGGLVALGGLISHGPPLERWGVRAPLLFIASVVFFGLAIRPLGLIITAFVTLMIASAATKEVRWVEAHHLGGLPDDLLRWPVHLWAQPPDFALAAVISP